MKNQLEDLRATKGKRYWGRTFANGFMMDDGTAAIYNIDVYSSRGRARESKSLYGGSIGPLSHLIEELQTPEWMSFWGQLDYARVFPPVEETNPVLHVQLYASKADADAAQKRHGGFVMPVNELASLDFLPPIKNRRPYYHPFAA